MIKEIQEIKEKLNHLEAMITKNEEKDLKPIADLTKRCSCGALMICCDNSDKSCLGYKCPACGNLKFSLLTA
jgi:hypothetical protein